MKKTMGRTSLIVMLALLLTKVIGQLRQILIGVQFGYNTIYADGFTQGFLIPDFVYTLLIGGAIQSTIVPYLAASIEKDEEDKGWYALSTFITLMSVLMATVLLLAELFAPQMMRYFATEQSLPIAIQASRALLPQAFFMMLAALTIGILNAYKKFISTSLTPCLYNALVLLSILFFAGQNGSAVWYTGLGITGSAFIYFLVQVLVAQKELKNFRPNFSWQSPDVKKLYRIALPTLISSSIPYVATFLISYYYRYFSDGTSYAYSNSISTWQLPFGVFVIAISNVMLPHITELCARKDLQGAAELFLKALRAALLIMLPSAIIFYGLRTEIIRGIFKWNALMSEETVSFTAGIFAIYCFVIITQTFAFLLNSFFYANHKTWVPMLAAVVSLIVHAGVTYPLVHYYRLGPQAMAIGFAVGSTVSVCVLTLFLLYFYRSNFRLWVFTKFLAKICIAGFFAFGSLHLWQQATSYWYPESKLLQLFVTGWKSFAVFVIFYSFTWMFNVEEINQLLRRIIVKKS